MRGYLEVDQLAAAVADEETNVKGVEAKGLNHEQVGRPDGMRVIGQEGTPALAGRARASPPAIAPNGAGADPDSQLEELAANALGAPERVLLGHGCNQFPDFHAQARSTQSPAGAPPPIEPPTQAVPADDCLRPDENQMPPPIAMESADDQPEQLVPGAQAWAALGSESDLELLAQEEILEKEVVAAAEDSRKRGEQEPEEGEHHIRIAGLASGGGQVLSFALLRPSSSRRL